MADGVTERPYRRRSYVQQEHLAVEDEVAEGAAEVAAAEGDARGVIRRLFQAEDRYFFARASRIEHQEATYRVHCAAEECRAELAALGDRPDSPRAQQAAEDAREDEAEAHRATLEAIRAKLALEVDRLNAKRRALEYPPAPLLSPPAGPADGDSPPPIGLAAQRVDTGVTSMPPLVHCVSRMPTAGGCVEHPGEAEEHAQPYWAKPMDEWTMADIRSWLGTLNQSVLSYLFRGVSGAQLRMLTRRELLLLCADDRSVCDLLWGALVQVRAELESHFEFDMPVVREQLREACEAGNSAVVRDRISRNCINPDEPFPDGRTPLVVAAEGGYGNCVAALLHLGATVSLPCDDGTERTALHAACAHRPSDLPADCAECDPTEPHLRAVNLLIDAGADLMAEDAAGMIPLHYAVAHPIPTLVVDALLRRPGGQRRPLASAMIEARAADGRRPLDCASRVTYRGISGRMWLLDQLRQLRVIDSGDSGFTPTTTGSSHSLPVR
eukprot:TRINITY_DN21535_c0_g1_i1.p1 TRINITY_DN21535_c0_g1~~TRINITY_DN21535_c0_g1_i1.p1  ORF type:complete len:497 (+),score=156.08 TRINITY_DN21535_c0_g1_i1:77-1567(+)